jgi:DNA repair protein RecN (Recombination protein N)
MLLELRVENLLLIERAELRLGPGLNVLTGETGAGKTMLAHALDLLLGGRPRPGAVRPGAAEAWVEGVFELSEELRERLGDRLAPDAEEVVLARRVGADGRTRAYLDGRTATVGDLREAGELLLAFYGQHEHRKLSLASAQLEVLDGYCGPAQRKRRARCAVAHALVRAERARLSELSELAGAREREIDLLEFELREIDEVSPTEEEATALARERERLRHLEALRSGAFGAAAALAGQDDQPGAVGLLAGAEQGLEAVAGVDPELDGLAERFRALRFEAEDLSGELRRYEETVDAPEGRLDEVEDRLALFARLERKHGGSIEAVLAHAERCRARHAELSGAEEAFAGAEAALAAALNELDEAATGLHAAREAAGPELSAAVRERLGELAMEGASFEVELTPRPETSAAGSDHVEFLIAPNPGVPAGPLREIASGGETSRVMLALLGVAHGRGAGDARLLVFDEVDAGIGGQTARAVGAHLRELAEGRQILCITHLPQIASQAVRHFRIAKDLDREPAVTTVGDLGGDEVVGELVRMLGADSGDRAAHDHARELLKAA